MGRQQKSQSVTWWGDITGPSQFVAETIYTLSAGKSIIMKTGLPFHETFIQSVTDGLRVIESSLIVEEPISTDEDPGTYLIDFLGIRDDYRPHMSSAEHIKKSRRLENKLVRVVANDNSISKWIDFINQYKSDSLYNGLFLIEASNDTTVSATKMISVIKYSEFVTEHDSLMFAGLITNPEKSVSARLYMSAVAASLFGTNAEDITDFLVKYDISKSPLDILPDSVSLDSFSHKLWNAQVQELFPLIMRETRDFIKRWHVQIDEAFEYINSSQNYPGGLFPQGLLTSYGEPVNSYDDLELATIRYMMRKRCTDEYGYETADYVLYIPSETAQERLELLYDMRNTIAHGKVCAESDVVRLLQSK